MVGVVDVVDVVVADDAVISDDAVVSDDAVIADNAVIAVSALFTVFALVAVSPLVADTAVPHASIVTSVFLAADAGLDCCIDDSLLVALLRSTIRGHRAEVGESGIAEPEFLGLAEVVGVAAVGMPVVDLAAVASGGCSFA